MKIMKELTDEEIEKAGENEFNPFESANAQIAFRRGAKFARDHSPKFKTLEEIGWEPDTIWEYHYVTTEFGEYRVRNYPHFFRVVFPGQVAIDCLSIYHGKQLAQSDYENKLKALLK